MMHEGNNEIPIPNPFPFPYHYSVSPTHEDLIGYLTLKIFDIPFPDPLYRFGPLHIYDHGPQQLYDLYRSQAESEMYNFEVDRKHSGENYFTREAGNGFWKFHGFEPVTMGERAATVRHVKHTEGPIMGPFSTTTLRYYRLMIKHHHIQFGSYTRDAVRDLLKGLIQGKHIIGYKTRLVYYEGLQAKCGTKTNWVMDEYRVNVNYLPNSKKMSNLVLCKIYQNDQKKEEESTSDDFPKPFAEVFARLYSMPKLPIDLFSKF